jgi:predicted phosphodiesterase
VSLSERLEDLVTPGVSGSDVRPNEYPDPTWKPRVERDEKSAFIVAKPQKLGELSDFDEIIKEAGLDPALWVVTNYKHSKWQIWGGDWLESVKLSVTPADVVQKEDLLDVEKLIDQIKKWRPTNKKPVTGDLSYVFALSDQQIGKKAEFGGTPEFLQRALDLTDDGIERFKELRKIGRPVGTIVIPLLGDHVEGNTSQGGKLQSYSASDLGITEQNRVARRLLEKQIKAFAGLSEKIIVPVVNGNHDEVTRQVNVKPGDGWNVEIASQVQDICKENEFLRDHVEFRYPHDRHQTLAIEINGFWLGLFHGHQYSGANAKKYLEGQAVGQTPLGSCDLWISGHYHHFQVLDLGPRTWIQCPTMDGGSAWFRDRKGLESPPGVLTLVIGKDYDPRRDLSVLRAKN